MLNLRIIVFAALAYLLEELIEHHVVHLARSGTVQLDDLLVLWPVAVQRPELAACVTEQHQEVFRLGPGDLLQHLLFGLAINGTREDTVLDGIQDNAPV